MQVTCHRNMFLEVFNIIDDTELEFMVTFKETNIGEMKVIRTRDFMLIEATLGFKVDEEVICDETYVFPDNQLLIKGSMNLFRPIKGIFKKDARTNTMKMNFSEYGLNFEVEDGRKASYQIN